MYRSLVLSNMHLLTLSSASNLEVSNLRSGDGDGTDSRSVACRSLIRTPIISVPAAKSFLDSNLSKISDTVRQIIARKRQEQCVPLVGSYPLPILRVRVALVCARSIILQAVRDTLEVLGPNLPRLEFVGPLAGFEFFTRTGTAL
jgi:hypothetical protein